MHKKVYILILTELIRMSEKKICQSCGAVMKSAGEYGTNEDGSKNSDYCCYCYKDGRFIYEGSMENFVKLLVKVAKDKGQDEKKAREEALKLLPTLKRWKGNYLEESIFS
jgi:hypothetical protein